LIKTQVVPGSFLGFPNCTDACDSIITTPDSPCSIYTLDHTSAITCFCKNTTLFDEVVTCAASYCTPSDLEAAFVLAAGACQDLGVTIATPSVRGVTLSYAASTAITSSSPTVLVSSTATTSHSSAITAKVSSTAATPAVSHAVSTTAAQSNKISTTTSRHNVTATSSSNVTAFTGGANLIMANNLLAGLGLGLYCALL